MGHAAIPELGSPVFGPSFSTLGPSAWLCQTHSSCQRLEWASVLSAVAAANYRHSLPPLPGCRVPSDPPFHNLLCSQAPGSSVSPTGLCFSSVPLGVFSSLSFPPPLGMTCNTGTLTLNSSLRAQTPLYLPHVLGLASQGFIFLLK